ncbi:MAG: hypothetical protein LBS87_00285 [Puniceicoccales bacterium]|jgi:uncharacterized alkaline shock family protein YloU|nr:hypothetical protein [Puniceicoccales bacterium]
MSVNLPTWLSELVASDYFIGAASLLFLLILAKIFFKKRWIAVSRSKFGKIRMSRRALYAIVYGVTGNVEGIANRRVKLEIKRGKIYINIHIKLDICRNISSLSEDVQMRLNEILAKSLGLDNVGKINVVIAGFSRESCYSNEFLAENCCEPKTEQSADEAG